MGSNPFGIGGESTKSDEDNFITNIFYFMKECHHYPLEEEFEVELIYEKVWWKFKRLKTVKLKKKGISTPMFNAMMKEMNEHYKREAEESKKSSKGR